MATGRPEGGGKGQSSSLKNGSLQGFTAARANSQGLLQRMANEAVRGNNERQLASVHSELNARTLMMQHAMEQQKFLTQGRGGGENGVPGSGSVHEQEEGHRQAAQMHWDIYNMDFRTRPFVQGGANDGDTQPITKQSKAKAKATPSSTTETGQPFRTPEEVRKTKQEALDLWSGPRPQGAPGDVNPNSKRERVGNPSQFSGTPGPEARGHDTTVTGEIVGEGRPFHSPPRPAEEPVTGELVKTPMPLGSRTRKAVAGFSPLALSSGPGAHPHISDLKGAKRTKSGQWSVPREHLEPFGGVAGYKHPSWKYMGGNKTHARFGSINDQSTGESESTNSMI